MQQRLPHVQYDFFQAEFALARTFIRIGISATENDRAVRAIRLAREALDTVQRLLPKSQLSEDQRLEVSEELSDLKRELLHLGEARLVRPSDSIVQR